MPRIYNFKHSKNIPYDAIRCDRQSPYGNPFIIGVHGNREQVCDMYDSWIIDSEQESLREKIRKELKGKDLICWCEPERCHCRTIMKIANSPE